MKEVERVTLVLPKALWEDVKNLTPSGGRSRLVVEAIEAEVRRRKRIEQVNRIRQLQESLRSKYGELPSSADDIDRMREEHDGEF
jgi:hypothetical protein